MWDMVTIEQNYAEFFELQSRRASQLSSGYDSDGGIRIWQLFGGMRTVSAVLRPLRQKNGESDNYATASNSLLDQFQRIRTMLAEGRSAEAVQIVTTPNSAHRNSAQKLTLILWNCERCSVECCHLFSRLRASAFFKADSSRVNSTGQIT